MIITYILAIAGLIVVAVAILYNRLIVDRNRVEEAWSDIEVQLKRRYDLIPNLIATVKGYAAHEAGVFTKVTEARQVAMNAGSMVERQQDEVALTGALHSLFAVAEAYPELKADRNFLQMQADIRDTEDKVQAARRFYNGTVRDYNTSIQTFPSNLLASRFGFTKKEFFDIPDNGPESAPPTVSF